MKPLVIAAGIAAAVLATIVLPAEYGIDPLRTGRALGLTALSSPGRPANTQSVVTPGLKQDFYEVELRPFEGVEYKYRMEKSASMVFAWAATDIVNFEFHGEPDGAPAKYFDSYEKSQNRESHGAFTAPASGIHGWFWENQGTTRIRIKLTTSGFYGDATEFRDGDLIVHHPATFTGGPK